MKVLPVFWLGRRSYREGLAWQAWAAEQVRRHATLLLLEHDPVVTVGTGGGWDLFRQSPEGLAQAGIEIWQVGRGGKVTYHGPGQLVGYPVLDLNEFGRDVHRYLRLLEDSLIELCGRYGLLAGRWPGKTGVWVGGAKIAAIGIRVARWVTYHGFAFNVAPDLTAFDWIVPCGLPDPVTSLARLVGPACPPLPVVAQVYAECFQAVFGLPGVEWVEAAGVPCPGPPPDVRPVPSFLNAWRSPL
ncbi:MAG: lipoyl(octanoyl) transferase LipB [Acidobacteria bacterium]|nr:lipoyl(octanoyl) transferase LipB [Acidobacteriota bacterium]MDW7983573.1 lipoyl(octanoyl) transferase LipB [Acidobacteriota bacterium]